MVKMAQGNNRNPFNNYEGYPDPTAYEAERNIEKPTAEEQKKVSDLIGVLKYIIDKAGYILIGRIKLKDKKSGKEFK